MTKPCLLVVDDEPMNLEILVEALTDDGYSTVAVNNGDAALAALDAEPDRFHAVLLDRMMPGMNGIEVLERMKDNERLRFIPVILQTARAASDDVREGMQAGAYYYLCKPFDDQTMLAVVRSAVGDYRRYLDLQHQQKRTEKALQLATTMSFEIRTPDEAREVSALLAAVLPNGSGLGIGLMELLLNGIEHGNLGIDYRTKSELLASDRWADEVEQRLALPENSGKRVRLRVERQCGGITFTISDEGAGFEWDRYLDFSPERAFDLHGRGIAMARTVSFSSVEYQGCGNEVIARVGTVDTSSSVDTSPAAKAA